MTRHGRSSLTGSSLYKSEGSHGCVHFPAAAMTRLYQWAPVGTTVTIRK